MGRKIAELLGKKYGRLTVIEYVGQNHRGKSMWKCRCDCGNTSIVLGTRLTSGQTKSCGCYNTETIKERVTTHGMSKTRLYNIWKGMLKRCYYENSTNYEHYGKKGIRICEEWLNFEGFRDWATTHGYADNLTIDRMDNDSNYSPDNCRWVDMKTQERNTTRNKFITFRGETHCLIEWAEIVGINYRTLQGRIFRYGWSIERALSTPTGNRG